jgi:hypothetical protein
MAGRVSLACLSNRVGVRRNTVGQHTVQSREGNL